MTEWLIQSLEVINIFHTMNVVHRDIKPENMIVKKQDKNRIVFIDYGGIGVVSEGDEIMMSMIGTKAYRPYVDGIYGKEVDISALAIVFFELITKNSDFLSFKENDDFHKFFLDNLAKVNQQNLLFFKCIILNILTKKMVNIQEILNLEGIKYIQSVIYPKTHEFTFTYFSENLFLSFILLLDDSFDPYSIQLHLHQLQKLIQLNSNNFSFLFLLENGLLLRLFSLLDSNAFSENKKFLYDFLHFLLVKSQRVFTLLEQKLVENFFIENKKFLFLILEDFLAERYEPLSGILIILCKNAFLVFFLLNKFGFEQKLLKNSQNLDAANPFLKQLISVWAHFHQSTKLGDQKVLSWLKDLQDTQFMNEIVLIKLIHFEKPYILVNPFNFKNFSKILQKVTLRIDQLMELFLDVPALINLLGVFQVCSKSILGDRPFLQYGVKTRDSEYLCAHCHFSRLKKGQSNHDYYPIVKQRHVCSNTQFSTASPNFLQALVNFPANYQSNLSLQIVDNCKFYSNSAEQEVNYNFDHTWEITNSPSFSKENYRFYRIQDCGFPYKFKARPSVDILVYFEVQLKKALPNQFKEDGFQAPIFIGLSCFQNHHSIEPVGKQPGTSFPLFFFFHPFIANVTECR